MIALLLLALLVGCPGCPDPDRWSKGPTVFPCITKAFYLPRVTHGEASCRADQVAEVLMAGGSAIAASGGIASDAQASAGGPVLLCTCVETQGSPPCLTPQPSPPACPPPWRSRSRRSASPPETRHDRPSR